MAQLCTVICKRISRSVALTTRIRPSTTFLVVLWILFPFLFQNLSEPSVLQAQVQNGKPDAPQGDRSANAARTLEARYALNQVLFRQRQLKTSLTFAMQHLRTGRTADALSALQAILDQDR